MNLFSLEFFIYFPVFLLAVILAFYFPGHFFLKKLKLPVFQEVVLSTIFGLVLWTWQAIVFGYLDLRFLTYIYVLVFALLWIRDKPLFSKKFDFHKGFNRRNIPFISIIVLGVITQVSSLWYTGFDLGGELYVCCGNYHDNLFHAALTNEITDNFPPFQPGLHGRIVENYHYLSNVVVAELIRIFNFPLFIIQFQFFGIFLSLFLGLTAMVFAQVLKLSKSFSLWLLFFLYFGGDLIFIPLSIASGEINFSMSSLEDGIKFLENLPRAFSIVIFFSLLSFIYLWLKKSNKILGAVVALTVSALIGFKVYTGIFAFTGLGFLGLYLLGKREYRRIIYLFISGLLGLIIYLPVNVGAGGLYFVGMWRFENLIAQPQLGLVKYELEREIYRAHANWPKLLIYESLYFIFYIVVIFGTKLIGFFQTITSLKRLPLEIHIILLPALIVSAILGFFFNQTSGGANTFNFLVSVYIIISIYAALSASYWVEKLGRIGFIFAFILIVLTIPRVLFGLSSNIANILERDGFHISNEHIQAFQYVRDNTPQGSLIFIDHRYFEKDKESPYISIFTDRPIFLSSMGILKSHNIDYEAREKSSKYITTTQKPVVLARELINNNIDYILTKSDQLLNATQSAQFIHTEYSNQEVKVLKVNHSLAKQFLEKSENAIK